MEFTTLGNTGLKVSRLGAGLVEIGNQLTFDEVDQAAQVLNTALDNGITFFDTAECYGISEELIGRTVAHRRPEFVLATKAGHIAGGYSGTLAAHVVMQLDRGGWSIPSGAAFDDIRIQCSLRQIPHIGNALRLVLKTLNENVANPPPFFLWFGDPRQLVQEFLLGIDNMQVRLEMPGEFLDNQIPLILAQ